MNWWKIAKIAVVVALVVAIGGYVYEKVSRIRLDRSTTATIERWESDYQSLLDGLQSITDILEDSSDEFGDYYDGSGDLADFISTSQGLAREIRDDNLRLGAENNRLRDILGISISGAGTIAEHSKIAGSAIGDSIAILEGYSGDDNSGDAGETHTGSEGSGSEVPDSDPDS